MTVYSNKFVKEVACTFTFEEGDTKWDSAYFGQYFDKIKDRGFTKRDERRGFQINLQTDFADISNSQSSFTDAGIQMIFQDPVKGYAITMSKASLSFHIIGSYQGWGNFNNDLLKPFFEIYKELHLYDKVNFCQVVYLNQFEFDQKQELSSLFTVVTSPFEGFDPNPTLFIQQNYLDSNSGQNLTFKLATQNVTGKQVITLECGSWNAKNIDKGADAVLFANQVKKPMRDLFECLITDKLRTQL